MKRVFVAIDVSDEARRRVSAYSETLRREFPHLRAGWEKAEKLHLTLKFLGDANEGQLNNLSETVGKIAGQISTFKLEIGGTGVFPSPRNARVLWLGVKDEKGSLLKMSEILEGESAKIGFRPETRNFKAHLTVARLREPNNAVEIARKHLQNEFEPVEFEVSEIVIYESKLQSTGSIYSIVSKYELNLTER
ncbi:MAG TPA: RNA 2',3'-cyclic phosphodiesterase [Pyrinomonadaceae bacterium]|jgi:2'-5' RNA ligase